MYTLKFLSIEFSKANLSQSAYIETDCYVTSHSARTRYGIS